MSLDEEIKELELLIIQRHEESTRIDKLFADLLYQIKSDPTIKTRGDIGELFWKHNQQLRFADIDNIDIDINAQLGDIISGEKNQDDKITKDVE